MYITTSALKTILRKQDLTYSCDPPRTHSFVVLASVFKVFLLVSLHKSQMKMEEELKTTVTVSANCETLDMSSCSIIVDK